MRSDILLWLPIENRPATNPYTAVILCQSTAFLLQRFPNTSVEIVVLRTAVHIIETIIHRLHTPFHISCRSHMSTVITGISIIVIVSLKEWKIHIHLKTIGFGSCGITISRNVTISFLRCQFPRHPLRIQFVEIIHQCVCVITHQSRRIRDSPRRTLHPQFLHRISAPAATDNHKYGECEYDIMLERIKKFHIKGTLQNIIYNNGPLLKFYANIYKMRSTNRDFFSPSTTPSGK